MRHDKKHEPNRSEPHSGQIPITTRRGDRFMADAKLVPLLKALDHSGLNTYSHCAGHAKGEGAWLVLDLDGLDVEIRAAHDMGNGIIRPAQVVLRWLAPWNS